MHVNLDPQLVDKIAYEVKSQGVFDQFRKGSIADVDTKPAYQNLRQRVENTVNKFLSDQIWTPDMNKNQLRERLRKHITEAGFLDIGVERIVDQVVNPKIATVFQPKIEDIAYKYLGIPKPQPIVPVSSADVPPLNGILKVETDLLPTDLEQVSPDSDKSTVKSDSKDEMEIEDKMDDFESPAFEPIEKAYSDNFNVESKLEKTKEINTEELRQPVPESYLFPFKQYQTKVKDDNSSEDWDVEENNKRVLEPTVKSEKAAPCYVSPGYVTQESQLSQVSSNSRLSIVTNGNTQDDQSTACIIKEENNVNISEEAQMPKFNENSNSCSDRKPSEPLHFDIKKDEIIFEGTERKTEPPSEDTSPNTSDEQRVDSSMENKTIDTSEASDIRLPSHEFSFEKDSDFKFSKIEVKVDLEEPTKTISLDDSVDRELHIIEKSEISQCSISQNSTKFPMAKPKSPSATSSSLHSHHKSRHRDSEHSSSRHKKSSKDRRKDKDKYSSSSHKTPSSSTSKHHSSKSSSSQRTSAGTESDHHHHHRSSSSTHKAKSSSRHSKTSRSHNDSKESSRSRDRDRDRSKSRSDKTKGKSSKEKSDRNKTINDDHYSSKRKSRKSTDSNDEDSSREGCGGGPKESSNSQDNGTNGTNNSNVSSGTSSANKTKGEAGARVADTVDTSALSQLDCQKIVVLDNLPQNPETNFMEMDNACVQVDSANDKTTEECSFNGKSLFYFENETKTKEDVETRLNILTNMMENFRTILKTSFGTSHEHSTTESESGNASHETDYQSSIGVGRRGSLSPSVGSVKSPLNIPNNPATLTNATLTIDCIQYSDSSIPHCLNKRFKFDENLHTKVSPTSSDVSVNSKENEFIDKNSQSDSDSLGSRDVGKSGVNKAISAVAKRKAIVNRNQRYSSEDLYKPRPILSQRSRRRGFDAII